MYKQLIRLLFRFYSDTTYKRHWFISKFYGGCEGDIGWMVVLPAAATACNWERLGRRPPTFLYSLKATASNLNDQAGIYLEEFGNKLYAQLHISHKAP